jgi:hypothetical protein
MASQPVFLDKTPQVKMYFRDGQLSGLKVICACPLAAVALRSCGIELPEVPGLPCFPTVSEFS